MNKTIRRLYPLISIAVLTVGLAWIALSRVDPGESSALTTQAPQAGFLAPDFSLPDADGNLITLSNFRGQPVLLNLWASWCGPCRSEMPAMERIYTGLADIELVVLAVNATNQDSRSEALKFIEELGLTFPILFDEGGIVSQAYRLQALPSSYFIDRRGVIREVVIGGPMAEALIRTRVEALLED